MPIRFLIPACVVVGMAAFGAAAAQEMPGADWFAKLSVPVPTPNAILVCHGFGCHSRTLVALTASDRAVLTRLVAGKTPQAERQGIARAVAWFDRRVGPQAGTAGARASASGLAGDPSQFDCFDRTINTTSLLLVMEKLRLLRHHTVSDPRSRVFAPIVGSPHSSAVIAERASGRRWAIDPWPKGYGELPDVLPLKVWLAKD